LTGAEAQPFFIHQRFTGIIGLKIQKLQIRFINDFRVYFQDATVRRSNRKESGRFHAWKAGDLG
jgi:hypothetical protein